MPSVSLDAAATRTAQPPERWSLPRAAAFVTLVSGVLWFGIIATVSWLFT